MCREAQSFSYYPANQGFPLKYCIKLYHYLCVCREALSFSYYPANQGIPLKYFPFRGGNYQAPLVAIKVIKGFLPRTPNATQTDILDEECRSGVRFSKCCGTEDGFLAGTLF